MQCHYTLLWLLCAVVSGTTCSKCTTLVVSTKALAATSKPTASANLSTTSTTITRPKNTFLPYVHTAISMADSPIRPSAAPAYHEVLRRRKRAACTRSDIVQDCGQEPASVNASISTSTGGACGGTASNTGSTRATINAASYEFCKSKFPGKMGRVLHYGDPSISRTTTDGEGNDVTLQVLFDWSLNVPGTSTTMDTQGCYMGFVSATSVCGANATQPLVLGGHFDTIWNGVNTFFYVVVKPVAGVQDDSAAVSATAASSEAQHSTTLRGNVIAGATGATAGVVLVVITALLVFRRMKDGKPACGASTPTYMSPPRAPSPFPFSEKFGHTHQKSMQSTSTKRSGPYPAVAWLYDAFPKPPPKVAQERYSSATTLQAPGPWPHRSSTPMLTSSHTRVRSDLLSPTNTGGFRRGHISWQMNDTYKPQPLNRRSAPLLSLTPATSPSPTASSHRRVQSSNVHAPARPWPVQSSLQAPVTQWPVAPYLLQPTTEKTVAPKKVRPQSHVLSPFNRAGIRKPIEAFRRQHRKQQSSWGSHKYSCSIYSRGTCGESVAGGSRRPTVDKTEEPVPDIPAAHLKPEEAEEEEHVEEKASPTTRPGVSLRRSFFGSRKKKRLSRPQLARQMSAYYAASLESLNRNFSAAMGMQTAATESAPDLLSKNEFEGWVPAAPPTIAQLVDQETKMAAEQEANTVPLTATITAASDKSIHPALRGEVKPGVPDFSSWKAKLPIELEGSRPSLPPPVVEKRVKEKESPVDDYHHFLT